MLPVFVAVMLCLTTLYALRGGLMGNGREVTISGFDPSALLMGVIAVGAAVYFFGPMYGLALILAVMCTSSAMSPPAGSVAIRMRGSG